MLHPKPYPLQPSQITAPMRSEHPALDDLIAKSGVRSEGFRFIADDLLRRKWPTVAETGCARQEGNHEGDGMSTLLWAAVPNAEVHTFDISAEAVDVCRRLTKGNTSVHVWQRDGIAGLEWMSNRTLFTHGCSLLYLDSFDVDMRNPHLSAVHTLYEFIAGRGLLRPGSLVAIDDNLRRESDSAIFGKGMYVADFMERAGKPIVHDGYQLIWRW